MRSHLLEGKVRHRRSGPFTYGLEHDVWYAALDLAELDELDRRLRLFGHNRRAAAVFRDADHLPIRRADIAADDPRPPAGRGRGSGRLARDAGDEPARAGTRLQSGQLLPLPGRGRRAAGRGGRGAQHLRRAAPVYAQATRRRRDARSPFTARMDKDFYVSPFISVDGRLRGPRPRRARRASGSPSTSARTDGPCISTSLVLRRRELTDRALARMLVRYPLVTRKTIGLIHCTRSGCGSAGRHSSGTAGSATGRGGDPVNRRRPSRRSAVCGARVSSMKRRAESCWAPQAGSASVA